MIDLRRLEILRELDRCGTIAATAEAVHLTASAVSQQLAALSREAGTPMLEPAGRRVRLTEAAQMLLSHAHEIFTHLEHAEADLAAFRQGAAGTVRLGVFTTAIRGLAVPALRKLGRDGVRVQISEVNPEHAADELLARHVDVAVTLSPTGSLVNGSDSRLGGEHLFDDILDILLPADHRLAHCPEVDLAELSDEDWVGFPPDSVCWAITLDACARAGFTPRTMHTADAQAGIVALVEAGGGVAPIPRLAQAPHYDERVVVRPIAGHQAIRRISVQYRAGTANQPHIAPLLDVLRDLAKDPRALLALRRTAMVPGRTA